jgi:ribonuclease D
MNKQEELLRKLRGHLAYKKGVEPYVIFKDSELYEVLYVKPKTLEDLAKIKGFPAKGKRVAGWGQAIVDIFTTPDAIEDFDVKLDSSGEPVATTVMKKMNLF